MRPPDSVLGLVFVLAGVAVVTAAWGMEGMAGMSVGPGLLPLIVGVGFVIFGGILVVEGWPALRSSFAGRTSDRGAPGGRSYPLAVLVGLLAYILLLPLLGFLALSIAFVTVVIRVGGGSWLGSAAFAVLITAAIYALFVHGLRVPLPAGSLGFG